jgi:hypothetical protein
MPILKKIKIQLFPDARLRNGHGIATDNNPMYDAHLFLNSIWLMSKGKPVMNGVKKFIENVLPPVYLGQISSKIIDFRLRFDVSHENLPHLHEILYRPYFMTDVCIKKTKKYENSNFTKLSELKGRNLKCQDVKNNEGNERPSPKKYSRQNLLKLQPLTQNHKFINLGPVLSRACLPTMKASNIAKFITTNGTVAAKKELTQIFVPGKKVPSKVRLCQLLQTFRKGRTLVEKRTTQTRPNHQHQPQTPNPNPRHTNTHPNPPKPSPSHRTPTPPKPKPPTPNHQTHKPGRPNPKCVKPPSQLMTFKNKSKVGRITQTFKFVLPKQGRIVLNAAERREAKLLAEKMAEREYKSSKD